MQLLHVGGDALLRGAPFFRLGEAEAAVREIARGAGGLRGGGGQFAVGVVELAEGGGCCVVEDVEGWWHFWVVVGRRGGGAGAGGEGWV